MWRGWIACGKMRIFNEENSIKSFLSPASNLSPTTGLGRSDTVGSQVAAGHFRTGPRLQGFVLLFSFTPFLHTALVVVCIFSYWVN